MAFRQAVDLALYEKQITKAVGGLLKNAKVHLDAIENKVGGYIVSPTFSGMEQNQRQDILWMLLERNLDEWYRKKINCLLTMAPEEVDK